MTQHFIVIGNPITHSKSPDIHHAFAKQVGLDICYQRQYCPDHEASFAAVVAAFFAGGGIGANVTVPFKQLAHALCERDGSLSPHAEVAGAVNTLSQQEGRLVGDNTDGQGLVNHLKLLGWQLDGARVAIIGAGGASRGVLLPLYQAGVTQIVIANRTLSRATQLVQSFQETSAWLGSQADSTQGGILYTLSPEDALSACAIEALTGEFDLIINATSIGLSGETLPLSERLYTHHAYDMMYGRALPFLQHFAAQGAQTSDGYGMLVAQAALSFQCWTGQAVDIVAMLHQT